MSTDFEYAVMHRRFPNKLHRGPMGEQQARDWIREYGGSPNVFYVVRRVRTPPTDDFIEPEDREEGDPPVVIPTEAVDRLYEPLTDDEKRELLAAIRAYHRPGPHPVMSSAANKLEAQLHLSNTGHRIYEGP